MARMDQVEITLTIKQTGSGKRSEKTAKDLNTGNASRERNADDVKQAVENRCWWKWKAILEAQGLRRDKQR